MDEHVAQILLLWDVDHTLIENSGVSKENYALAFELLTGRPPDVQPQTDGRTDQGIMANLLAGNGEDPDAYSLEQQWDALLKAGKRQLTQLTHDHNLVQDLLDAGKLTSQQAAGHPQRSLLTRALGLAPTVEPGLSTAEVTGSARLLLCTDGLTAHASDAQIAALLSAETSPGQTAASLVQLANRNGGSDNTAVIVVDITPVA